MTALRKHKSGRFEPDLGARSALKIVVSAPRDVKSKGFEA